MKTNHSQSQGLPFIKISSNIPSPCNITITATGKAAEEAANCVGSYVPTDEWNCGRRILEGNERCLFVLDGRWTSLFVEETETDFIDVGIQSGCAPSFCPADPRAQRKYCVDVQGKDGHQSCWRFWHWGEDEDGDYGQEFYEGEIVVSCSVHNHHEEEFEDELGRLVAAEEARVAAEVMAQDSRLKAVESDERLQQVEVAPTVTLKSDLLPDIETFEPDHGLNAVKTPEPMGGAELLKQELVVDSVESYDKSALKKTETNEPLTGLEMAKNEMNDSEVPIELDEELNNLVLSIISD